MPCTYLPFVVRRGTIFPAVLGRPIIYLLVRPSAHSTALHTRAARIGRVARAGALTAHTPSSHLPATHLPDPCPPRSAQMLIHCTLLYLHLYHPGEQPRA